MTKVIDSLDMTTSKAHWESLSEEGRSGIIGLLSNGETPGEIEQKVQRMIKKQYPKMRPHKVREIAARFYLAANYCRYYVLNNESDGPDPDPAG